MDQFIYFGTNWANNSEQIYLLGDAILFLIFLVGVLYITIFAVSSLKKRKATYPTAKKKYRFAILISAYKADDTIINTVCSFLMQNYPRDKYDIIVTSDQMSEETNSNLIEKSTYVIKVNESNSSKTKALQTAVNYIKQNELMYDIVVVLDANNLVDIDFLEKINDAFYSGCSVVQTHRIAQNKDTSIELLDAVSEEINNSIFRKGHTQLGFSAALTGSGMAIEYDLFEDLISQAKYSDLDKQFEKSLLKQNIYIEYLEYVYVYDEKVKGKIGFYNQRRRWLASQFSNLFSGISHLLPAILKGNWDYCDKLFQWMMPPRIILFGFIFLFACIFTYANWILSIKWWGLLLLLCIAFSIAVPDYLVDKKFRKALLILPILFLLMFFNFFRLKRTGK